MKAKSSFNQLYNRLLSLVGNFATENILLKNQLLKSLQEHVLPEKKVLLSYCDTLLFICSHPQNAEQLQLAEKELKRITSFLKPKNRSQQPGYQNSGLPYSTIFTRFSHDCLAWLLSNDVFLVTIDSYSKEEDKLANVLKLTLPALERERTAVGYTSEELLEALHVKPKHHLKFIILQLSKFNGQPFLKDQLFEALDYYVNVSCKSPAFSKFYNRITHETTFFQDALIKNFDSGELLDRSLPPAKNLGIVQLQELVFCIKNSLLLKSRETDPVTYMDERSLRFFELERGISVAIYGMTPGRQLPLESYIGYTLFKNGFPAAYGGSWIFGSQALFGMNVFESYRGGESAFMMCQLLRVYRQMFGINYFEIEPYQFGKDNPEGIESGAYWFYYRLGFRSVDKEQRDLAEKEHQKIRTKKAYRSSYSTLKRLAESYVALMLGKYNTLSVGEISQKVSTLIEKEFKGDRNEAENMVVQNFRNKAHVNRSLTGEENDALKEMAFMACALNVSSPGQLELLKEMTLAKPKDVYRYQELLRHFLASL